MIKKGGNLSQMIHYSSWILLDRERERDCEPGLYKEWWGIFIYIWDEQLFALVLCNKIHVTSYLYHYSPFLALSSASTQNTHLYALSNEQMPTIMMDSPPLTRLYLPLKVWKSTFCPPWTPTQWGSASPIARNKEVRLLHQSEQEVSMNIHLGGN